MKWWVKIVKQNILLKNKVYILYASLALSLYYFSIIKPETAGMRKEETQLRYKLAIAEQNPGLFFYKNQLITQQHKVKNFIRNIKDKPSIAKLIQTLKSGDASRLKLEIFSPKFVTKNTENSQEVVNITVSGEFYQLNAFLQNIAQFNIKFHQLEISKISKESKKLQMQILVHFFKREHNEI